jgi:hypothetical protein
MSGDLDVFTLDGTVISSSQQEYEAHVVDQYMPLMHGIIINVQPADARDNFSSLQKEDRRGHRHECTVLASDTLGKQPDTLLKHVVIPPERPSGLDNFEEDLPRGCSKTIDNSRYDDEFVGNFNKLDGEWCVVGFVGGKLQDPFILRWWPHPANVYAPASRGFGHPVGEDEIPGEALVQADTDRNRSRAMRRVNGAIFLVNKEGSFYLDTTESNSMTEVEGGKLKRSKVDKGGHIQIDICKDAQMEFNWNEKETSDSGKPRIGANSDSNTQQHDLDLPHERQPVKGSPSARNTNRTYFRAKEFEALLKTSDLNIYCENTNGNDGQFLLLANDVVTISQAEKTNGSVETSAYVQIADGKITVQGKSGDLVSVTDDQIVLVTASGAQVSLVGDKVLVSGTTVSIPAPTAIGQGVGDPTNSPTDAAVLGTSFLTALTTPPITPVPGDGGEAVLAGIITALRASLSTQVTLGK